MINYGSIILVENRAGAVASPRAQKSRPAGLLAMVARFSIAKIFCFLSFLIIPRCVLATLEDDVASIRAQCSALDSTLWEIWNVNLASQGLLYDIDGNSFLIHDCLQSLTNEVSSLLTACEGMSDILTGIETNTYHTSLVADQLATYVISIDTRFQNLASYIANINSLVSTINGGVSTLSQYVVMLQTSLSSFYTSWQTFSYQVLLKLDNILLSVKDIPSALTNLTEAVEEASSNIDSLHTEFQLGFGGMSVEIQGQTVYLKDIATAIEHQDFDGIVRELVAIHSLYQQNFSTYQQPFYEDYLNSMSSYYLNSYYRLSNNSFTTIPSTQSFGRGFQVLGLLLNRAGDVETASNTILAGIYNAVTNIGFSANTKPLTNSYTSLRKWEPLQGGDVWQNVTKRYETTIPSTTNITDFLYEAVKLSSTQRGQGVELLTLIYYSIVTNTASGFNESSANSVMDEITSSLDELNPSFNFDFIPGTYRSSPSSLDSALTNQGLPSSLRFRIPAFGEYMPERYIDISTTSSSSFFENCRRVSIFLCWGSAAILCLVFFIRGIKVVNNVFESYLKSWWQSAVKL